MLISIIGEFENIKFMNFGDFVSTFDGLLHSRFRSFNNPRDPIHLGREGINRLICKFQEAVLKPKVDARGYNVVTSGMGVGRLLPT